MENNKKSSKPVEEERWTIIRYMCTHRPPWWLYWTPALMLSIILVIEAIPAPPSMPTAPKSAPLPPCGCPSGSARTGRICC